MRLLIHTDLEKEKRVTGRRTMKSKDELRRELDQTQQMINAAENAMRFGLTLDGDSFTRYTDAVERQKQIAEDLSGYSETTKGLVVSTAMHGKQSELINTKKNSSITKQ